MTDARIIQMLLPFSIADRIEDYPGKSQTVDIVSCSTERFIIVARDLPRALAERILLDVNPPEETEEERLVREQEEDLL